MKKYFVVATKWSNEDRAEIRYIAGEFTEYILARIFKEAYNEHYKADAIIIDEWNMLNR